MDAQTTLNQPTNRSKINVHRSLLMASIPAKERRFNLAGISTAILEGGKGPPIILLHGPGESSVWWMRVIPKLMDNHKVIVPDLPGHGESKVNSNELNTDLVFSWLSDLIEQICSFPPVLVGNILGGSIAARYATDHGDQLSQLVLVNSLGLGKFRPAPGFAFRLMRFMLWPTEKNFNHFFPQCMYDVDELRKAMGGDWEPFLKYNLECARDKERSDALQFMMKKLGIPKIPAENLRKINIPVTLIWGRHDRANKLRIAENASKQFGWPLYIIEDTRDDPKLERPAAFVDALYNIIKENKK